MYRSIFVALVFVSGFQPAFAASIVVNSTGDTVDATPGDGTCGSGLPGSSCTVRAAIQEANATAGTDTITFSVAGPTTLLTSLPDITRPVVVDGGAGYTIDGNGLAGLVRVPSAAEAGAYSLTNLTLTGGTTSNGAGGGAVYFAPVAQASLTLTNVTITGNAATAGPGGGVALEVLNNASSVALVNVDINTNTASGNGGGLWLRIGGAGSASLDDSTIADNTAGDGGNGNGGGIHVRRGRLSIGNTTISGNTATGTGQGGGIFLEGEDATSGGSVRMDNVTVSANTNDGIAVEADNVAASWVTFSTIAGNTGAGIRAATPATSFPGNVSNPFTANIVGDNTNNCTAAFSHSDSANSGFNLTNGSSCGFAQASDKVVAAAADLKLAGLADNPSPPQTRALTAGSPAIDAGNPAWSTGADQRGADAQDGGADGTPGNGTAVRDIGAYEYGGYGLVQFSAANFDVDEDSGPAQVLIKRYGTGTAATTAPKVSYSTATIVNEAKQGNCSTTTDYDAVDGPITANPLEFTFSATPGTTQFDLVAAMTICNVDAEEADAATETFSIALASAAAGDAVGFDFGPNQSGTVTIHDAENGTFQFNPLTYAAAEGNPGANGSATLTITRTGGTHGAVRVSYATRTGTACDGPDCTATEGTDYTAASTFVDFADGDASKTITIDFIGDSAYESNVNETFEVAISGVACQGLAAGQDCDARVNPTAANLIADVTINNDDTALPGTLQLEAVTYQALETGGTLAVKVKRVGGSDGQVSVGYGSTDGTAVAGLAEDYYLDPVNPHTVTWNDTDSADKTITINLVNDAATVESNKTFTLTLATPTGNATIDPAFDEAVVTIVSDEQPAFQFADTTVSTNEGTAAAVQIIWDAFEGGPVEIGYYTQDGTAVSPVDYTGIPQGTPTTLTINPGDPASKGNVSIATAADAAAESNENFSVVLNAPTGGATLGADTPAVVQITDPAGVRFTSTTYTRANEQNGQTITATVERIGDTSAPLSVDFSISDACDTPPCATQGTDYTRSGGFSGTLSWAGTTSNANEAPTKTFSVTVIGDTLIEGDEGIKLALSNARNNPPSGTAAQLGTAAATAVIPDDDYRFEIVETSPLSVGEGAGNAVVTVRRVGSTLGAATVGFATADDTATAGSDYTATASPPALSWAAGEGGNAQLRTITVPVTNDTEAESTEAFTVALNTPSANVSGEATSVSGSPVTVQIADNEASVAFAAATQTVTEAAGTVTVTATRTGATDFAVTVPFTVTNAGSIANTAADGNIVIAAGDSSGTYQFTVTDDAKDGADQAVTFTMGTPSGGTGTVSTVAPTTHDVTITDNDAVTVAFSAAAQTVAEAVGSVTVTVTRTGATDFDISVPFTVSGTAVAPADHDAAAGTITILAGATSGSYTFNVVDDAIQETDETVVFTMGTPTGGNVTSTAPSTHTVTIGVNDVPPPDDGGSWSLLGLWMLLPAWLRRRRAA